MVVADQLEPAEEALVKTLVDHRSVEHVLERVADRRLLDRAREAAHELVVHRLVDDGGAERGAALAGRAEAAEQGALHGQVELGVGHHDERVLPAQLETGRLDVAAAELPDPRADSRRAGESNLVDQPLRERTLQTLEGGRAVALHEVQHAVGQPAVQEELGERVADRRRVLGRLPDDRIAGEQGRDHVPGGNRHGEVPGGDDRRDAHGRAEREQLLVRHLARNGHAVQAPALREEEVAGVHDLLHLAEGLGVGLPDLPGHEAREGLLVLLHQPADLRDRAAAHGRRHGGPFALRRARGAARVHEGVGVAQ